MTDRWTDQQMKSMHVTTYKNICSQRLAHLSRKMCKLHTQYSLLFFSTLHFKILLFFLDSIRHVLYHCQLSLLFWCQVTDAFFILVLQNTNSIFLTMIMFEKCKIIYACQGIHKESCLHKHCLERSKVTVIGPLT